MLLSVWDSLSPKMRLSIKTALLSGRYFPRAVERTVASLVATRDKPLIEMLPEICSKHRVAVDVGANLGGFAWHLSSHVAKVICIEPNPVAARFLRACNHPQYQILEKAASDSAEGRVSLFVPVRAAGSSLARGSLEQSAVRSFDEVEQFSVEKTVLDSLTDDVCFIKIDCEGHERAVLRGARRLLERTRPLLYVEIEQRHCAEPILETFSMIEESYGYGGAFFRGRALTPISEFSLERDQLSSVRDSDSIAYINNFLFFPTDRASEFFAISGRT
ncbi:MAG: FkbM family methyltransferase [Proteobacteria bacterium]|nr:FkbM family methyltransferase [Pseudomonadota bacterium]